MAQTSQLSSLLTQVLINRGIHTPEAAQMFLKPETQILPSPMEEFPDLPIALELMLNAIAHRQPIAICGDYDADGMTSTALLLRALRVLGAIVDYAIPSRMQEGYGMNRRIVEEFYEEGVQLILTVDNGIAAHEPIARARELGLTVIVTDHHDLPEVLPIANAILNPKLIRENSPYRGVAGVGVAYILAVCLAQCLNKTQDLTTPLIELFTLGTIADLAPLTGVNRRWVRRGLKLLPKSRIVGIQALIQVAGLGSERALKPEAIGFRLGPRINAIGRLADPQIVIELLTTDDEGQALELAMKCEQVNQYRQRLCELIEQEAIAWCEATQFDGQKERVLVIVQPEWHHGVIGIVASRLVERYGVPVFIGTYEEPNEEAPGAAVEAKKIRGSARSIPEFNVFEALQYCRDLLGRFGGHRAAGGFTFAAENLEAVRSRLREYAYQQLSPDCLKPLVAIDTQAALDDLSLDLFEQIDHLHPCGIENSDPVFWTPNVRILEQQTMGRNQAHLKVTVVQEQRGTSQPLKAIAWRWGEYYPLPSRVDIAYRLRVNEWNGARTVELELIGMRLADAAIDERPDQLPDELPDRSPDESPAQSPDQLASEVRSSEPSNGIKPPTQAHTRLQEPRTRYLNQPEIESPIQTAVLPEISTLPEISDDLPCFSLDGDSAVAKAVFYYNKRQYTGSIHPIAHTKELRIRNASGQILAVQPQQRQGFLGKRRQESEAVDVSQPKYFNLIRAALWALELAQKQQILAEKDQQIAILTQQVELLNQQLIQRAYPQSVDCPDPEASIAPPVTARLTEPRSAVKPEALKRQLKAQLGETVWNSLSSSSHRDLTAAYRSLAAIQVEPFTVSVVDYSEAGQKLGLVVDREIVQPFFKQLHSFLQTTGDREIGGIVLKARKKYALSLLPPLLTTEWQELRQEALESCESLPQSCCQVMTDGINPRDRALIQACLQQWQHPLAQWFLNPEAKAASAIAQIAQLQSIATQPELFLHQWQFEWLQGLIIGTPTEPGILSAIYNDSNL
ncbi:MAG: single-stranded-DNA-specific exonuclease RecJ [Drouetiella hepatica Uher 2000/2452]|uniref:Single-stranded-DNA-specific exonuclease RecJ n=1 Tax=Drouetiella hepatica Uher 2000/2452 TaxID=904376 RepID=A0A951QHF7_9CYAN|nr:single-stranded-DNA-specific exonuclease RecJ [Drouetiella hepatica Uher 2000/2452]